MADPEPLSGQLAVRRTLLSVFLILECLANEMTLDDISESFGGLVSREALSEVVKVAGEMAEPFRLAAG